MKLSPTQIIIIGLSLLVSGFVVSSSALLAQNEAKRWVEIRVIKGSVTYQGQPARVGDRLAVGEKLSTGSNSSAFLVFDEGIGTVIVSELTNLQVKNLDILPNGARTTKLFANRGQVRAKTRKMNNPNSRFEIAFRGDDENEEGGVAGSRGTEYGVAVSPNGITGVSTLSGEVAVVAQQQTELVTAGTASLIVPGQPPTYPKITNGGVKFNLKLLSVTEFQQVRVQAVVDPINLVFLNGQAIATERDGKIDTVVPLPANRLIRIVVRNPLGEEQVYELEVS